MSATLHLNDVERFLLIQHMRDERRVGDRASARRTAAVLEALQDEEWDESCRAIAAAAEAGGRDPRAAVATHINDLDPKAPPENYKLERADVDYLRDELRKLDEQRQIPLRLSRLWLRLLDKVDSAYEQARDGSDGKGKPATAPVVVSLPTEANT